MPRPAEPCPAKHQSTPRELTPKAVGLCDPQPYLLADARYRFDPIAIADLPTSSERCWPTADCVATTLWFVELGRLLPVADCLVRRDLSTTNAAPLDANLINQAEPH